MVNIRISHGPLELVYGPLPWYIFSSFVERLKFNVTNVDENNFVNKIGPLVWKQP